MVQGNLRSLRHGYEIASRIKLPGQGAFLEGRLYVLFFSGEERWEIIYSVGGNGGGMRGVVVEVGKIM